MSAAALRGMVAQADRQLRAVDQRRDPPSLGRPLMSAAALRGMVAQVDRNFRGVDQRRDPTRRGCRLIARPAHNGGAAALSPTAAPRVIAVRRPAPTAPPPPRSPSP